MTTPLLAGVLIGVGLGLTILGIAGNRYHNQRFQEHRERLQQAEDGEIAQEVQRFHDDDSVDLAITLLYLQPIGWLLLIGGGLLLVTVL